MNIKRKTLLKTKNKWIDSTLMPLLLEKLLEKLMKQIKLKDKLLYKPKEDYPNLSLSKIKKLSKLEKPLPELGFKVS